jgi:hypothetical protein
MSQIPNDPELNDVESSLRGLTPNPSALDRDRLMFQAGALSRSGTRHPHWIWPSAAAVLSLVVVGESILLASRPATRVVERLVVVREPAASEPTISPPSHIDSTPQPIVLTNQNDGLSSERPENAVRPNWEMTTDHRRFQDLVMRFGLDAFPASLRAAAEAEESADSPEPASASAGALRRMELEKLLNPGDHS